MRHPFLICLIILGHVLLAGGVAQARELAVMKTDQDQVRVWNRFADDLHHVHQYLISSHATRKVTSTGGYANRPDFFQQIEYFDRDSGLLLSRVQRETANPARIHTMEIFAYDRNGHLKRDYLIAYLPVHRNAPVQTLINVHAYSDGLHSFRQFDASGNRIYEQCSGTFFGEQILISLDEDEFPSSGSGLADETEEQAYLACFEYLPLVADPFLSPLSIIPVTATEGVNAQPSTQLVATEQKINALTFRLISEPENAMLYMKRGELYLVSHKFEQAIADYSKALQLDDTLDQAYFGRGMALGRAGQVEHGIKDLTVFIQRNPDSSLAYTKRGVRYLWIGDKQKAEFDLRRAIKLNPNNAEAHDDLGVIFARRGDIPQAIHQFQTVIKLDPEYQKGFHNLALSYFIAGQTEPALQHINHALKLSPRERNSLLLKSSILDALGQTAKARQLRDTAEFLPEGNWTERYPIR